MKHCTLTGIIKKFGGYGFSVVFTNAKDAQKYKEQIKYIIEVDKIQVKTKRGYYDANQD